MESGCAETSIQSGEAHECAGPQLRCAVCGRSRGADDVAGGPGGLCHHVELVLLKLDPLARLGLGGGCRSDRGCDHAGRSGAGEAGCGRGAGARHRGGGGRRDLVAVAVCSLVVGRIVLPNGKGGILVPGREVGSDGNIGGAHYVGVLAREGCGAKLARAAVGRIGGGAHLLAKRGVRVSAVLLALKPPGGGVWVVGEVAVATLAC